MQALTGEGEGERGTQEKMGGLAYPQTLFFSRVLASFPLPRLHLLRRLVGAGSGVRSEFSATLKTGMLSKSVVLHETQALL